MESRLRTSGVIPPQPLMLSWRVEEPHVYCTYTADYHYKKAQQNVDHDCTTSISETAIRQRSKNENLFIPISVYCTPLCSLKWTKNTFHFNTTLLVRILVIYKATCLRLATTHVLRYKSNVIPYVHICLPTLKSQGRCWRPVTFVLKAHPCTWVGQLDLGVAFGQ